MSVGPAKRHFQKTNLFSITERYILPYGLGWPGKICWVISFHLYSPNIRLWKDKFSWQHSKNLSQTLIYSVKAKSQAGNIWVKGIMTTQNGQNQKKIRKFYTLLKNSAGGLGFRREHCWGYVSIYENAPKKLLHHAPKRCYNFT